MLWIAGFTLIHIISLFPLEGIPCAFMIQSWKEFQERLLLLSPSPFVTKRLFHTVTKNHFWSPKKFLKWKIENISAVCLQFTILVFYLVVWLPKSAICLHFPDISCLFTSVSCLLFQLFVYNFINICYFCLHFKLFVYILPIYAACLHFYQYISYCLQKSAICLHFQLFIDTRCVFWISGQKVQFWHSVLFFDSLEE